MKKLAAALMIFVAILGFYNAAISAENLGGKITLTPDVSQGLEADNFDDLFRQTRVYLIKSDMGDYWRLEWSYNYNIINFLAFPRHIIIRKSYFFFDDADAKPWFHGSEIIIDNLVIEMELLDFKNDQNRGVNINTYMKVLATVKLETFDLKEKHYNLLIDALKNKQPITITGKIRLTKDSDLENLDHVLKGYQELILFIVPTQIGNLEVN